MDIIGLLSEHKLSSAIIAATVLSPLVALAIPQLSSLIIRFTALLLPPIAGLVKRTMVFLLAHPILRPIIIKNKEPIKKLEDAIVNCLTAMILAADVAFDESIDAAEQPK